jgi:cytochrome c553
MRIALALLTVAACLPAPTFANAKTGEEKAQLCVLCHRTGTLYGTGIPLLEGQPAKYLIAATLDFKSGKRNSPAMQPNIKRLTPRDIADIANHFAARLPTAGETIDSTKAAAGEARVRELNCASCHQATFAGLDATPRLAGQGSGYLAVQLEAFATGQRKHPVAGMPAPADYEPIAAYLASLR